MLGMAQSSSGKKVANGLVAAGTAAVLAVYAAGYTRTSSAASQLDAQSSERRRPAPASGGSAAPAAANSSAAPIASGPATPAREQRPAPQEMASLGVPAHAASIAPLPISAEHPSEVVNVPPTTLPSAAPPPPAAPTESAPAASSVSVVPAPAAAPAPPAQAEAKWKDGTYLGWGTCRHGDIQAQVVIAGGRITSATIAQCLTRYSCDIIGRLPPQVLQRQSAEVDYVSGATQSANAFYYAVLEALGKAK